MRRFPSSVPAACVPRWGLDGRHHVLEGSIRQCGERTAWIIRSARVSCGGLSGSLGATLRFVQVGDRGQHDSERRGADQRQEGAADERSAGPAASRHTPGRAHFREASR
jgi:hypothetical protein